MMKMAEALTKPIVEDVTLKDLKAGLADGSIVLIDVREPNEFMAGHIPGSILNPLQSFDTDALPAPQPGTRIVFSCRSGRRSIAALGLAQQAGRDDIRAHYPGGMLGWEGAGEPVEE
jgi:rhodanese-related sulfurtransferase